MLLKLRQSFWITLYNELDYFPYDVHNDDDVITIFQLFIFNTLAQQP